MHESNTTCKPRDETNPKKPSSAEVSTPSVQPTSQKHSHWLDAIICLPVVQTLD